MKNKKSATEKNLMSRVARYVGEQQKERVKELKKAISLLDEVLMIMEMLGEGEEEFDDSPITEEIDLSINTILDAQTFIDSIRMQIDEKGWEKEQEKRSKK